MAQTIDISVDSRPYYSLATMQEDVTLENVTRLQNQNNHVLTVTDTGASKVWKVLPYNVIVFDAPTTILIKKYGSTATVGVE